MSDVVDKSAEALPADTVWAEKVSFASKLPRWVSMLGLLILFLGLWQGVTSSGSSRR